MEISFPGNFGGSTIERYVLFPGCSYPFAPTAPVDITKMKKMENCAKCRFRAKYDENPKSLLGRMWRWHINFCPGWKGYFNSISSEEKAKLAEQYKYFERR